MNKKSDLSHYERQSMERINQLISEYCDGSQQRFSEMTGINKGSISQYCNGKNTPSNLTAKKIADRFHLNPAWVMGFDVPMVDDRIPGPDNLPNVLDKIKEKFARQPDHMIYTPLEELESVQMEEAVYGFSVRMMRYNDMLKQAKIQSLLDAADGCTDEQIQIATNVLNSYKPGNNSLEK